MEKEWGERVGKLARHLKRRGSSVRRVNEQKDKVSGYMGEMVEANEKNEVAQR